MEKSDIITIVFAAVIGLLVVFALSPSVQSLVIRWLGAERSISAGTQAPELRGIAGYINTEPFNLSSFVGKKVVLIDFWDYSCINCIRTLPHTVALYERYKDSGLVVIGVHTPEFQFEQNYANVQSAAREHGITYPVVLDNNYDTWNAYSNHYWPAQYLIGKDGSIVYTHIGEGDYGQIEAEVQAQLSKLNGSFSPAAGAANSTGAGADFSGIRTPEIYFGANFKRAPLGNEPALLGTGSPQSFTLPESIGQNVPYLGGVWVDRGDSLELSSDSGKIVLKYNAKSVNIVAGSTGSSTVSAILDGMDYGNETIGGYDLYRVADAQGYGQHRIELSISGRGFRIYTFTFG